MSSGTKSNTLNTTRMHRRSYTHVRDLSISCEGRSEVIQLRTPDLSVRGMFINTANYFPEGTVLKVRFRLETAAADIVTRAEVRYCLPGVGIGVEFIELSEEAKQMIEEALHQG